MAQQPQQRNGNCNGPPKGTNPSQCCQKSNSFDQRNFNQCITQHGNNPPRIGKGLQGPMNGMECVFDCALNATGTIENGRPNPQKLIQKATAVLGPSSEWSPVVTAGINFCMNQMSSNLTAIRNSLKGDVINGKSVCSPAAAYFFGCMFTYEFRNCPGKFWNGTRECNDLKTYFNLCPTPLLN
jgi:hypothetical protein